MKENKPHREYPGQAAAALVIAAGALWLVMWSAGDSVRHIADSLFHLKPEEMFMIPISALVFVAFWKIMDKSVIAPFLKLIETREAKTEGAELSVGEGRKKTVELLKQYEQNLTEARVVAMQAKLAHISAANKKAKEKIDVANKAALEKLGTARLAIKQESQSLKDQLLKDSESLVEAVINKITSTPESVSKSIQ